MIKILGGVVRFNGKNYKKDDIISSTDEHEKRLVLQGFAEYFVEAKGDKIITEEPKKDKDDAEETVEEFDPEKAMKLKVAELQDLAKSYGIKAEDLINDEGANKTKKEIVALIQEVLEREENAEETEEETEEDKDDAEENIDSEEDKDFNIGDGENGVE